jgi:hypothetical protein
MQQISGQYWEIDFSHHARGPQERLCGAVQMRLGSRATRVVVYFGTSAPECMPVCRQTAVGPEGGEEFWHELDGKREDSTFWF